MSDTDPTDLIVPVELHALVANHKVRSDAQHFMRWTPSLTLMLHPEIRGSAEPEPYNYQAVHEDPRFEGVHLQWQLPEALTTGHIDPDTGESRYPLVPNRWLVVRYSDVEGARRAAGWVVQSDYLESDGLGFDGSNSYLKPDADRPVIDRIGRAHSLADRPWAEPAAKPLFLTAVGAGLPAFAAFAPYHKNVFLFHDTLQDLREATDNHPPDATLSYAVVGWYSRDDADILKRAADIPGLLPPDADPRKPADVLAALGWAAPEGMPTTIARTRYAGTALGIGWQREGDFPQPLPPDGGSVKVALGHSTDDAAAAMVAHQTGSARSGDLVRALFHGDPDDLDTPDGTLVLNEVMRRAWFSGRDGGHTWHVVHRTGDDLDPPATVPRQPAWLDRLNTEQAALDTAMPELAHVQWRLWSLWWLRDLPTDQRPHDFAYDQAAWDAEVGALEDQARALQQTVDALRAQVPYAADPDELPAAIDAYARTQRLPHTLELKRSPQQTYHRPADPAMVLHGAGNTRPLGRDDDEPLPCRLPSRLLTKVRIADTDVSPEAAPLVPDLTGLPDVCTPLIAEMAMLDRAARTPAGTKSALHAIVEDPGTLTQGPFPEYTYVWSQPWLPMYLQWQIKYCAAPFRTGGQENWTFDGDAYRWNGTGVPTGDGEGNVRWTIFKGRSFLTPAVPYVLSEQAKRQTATAPAPLAQRLRALSGTFAAMDLLSQNLEGFNDWLLQHDGTAQVTTDPRIKDLAGESNHVPDGAGDRRQQRFQPVRGGQFYFTDLRIIDRFGQVLRMVGPQQSQPTQFAPIRAGSVTPDPELPLFTPAPPGPQRFIQLPPRLLQDTRIRLEPVHHSDDRPLQAVSTAADQGADTPVAGWLLVNHLDQSLLVYAPDGSPLGDLRVICTADHQRQIKWNPLPHAPFTEADDPDFAAAYPHAAGFVTGLLAQEPDTFALLMSTIDRALDSITDPAPEEDRAPARLIGRPVALVRARLALDLLGPPLTDSAWDRVLTPPTEDYQDYAWPVRLGEISRLTDGLIGYFTSKPGEETDYGHLYTPVQERDLPGNSAADDAPYLSLIGTGSHLAVPARPPGGTVTRYLSLLACPHTAIHASTDILPVATLKVDADVTHRALSAIRASFRLNPLLAPARPGTVATVTTTLGHTAGHPPEKMLDGDQSTYYFSGEWAGEGTEVVLDLGTGRQVTAVDLYLGNADGGYTPARTTLDASTDAETWTDLVVDRARTQEIHYRPATVLTARYLRLTVTAGQEFRMAIRRFEVTTDPADGGVFMPRPASWHGAWTWAEPLATDDGPPLWTELPILASDDRAHPDDPVPGARAGYLQLDPAGRGEGETS
ncbi:discoidin domain-containing protein [Streptomyces sp. DSM 41527]|uniref:Discoidin domain-containing protein n=1 Tax=Streptomyces mooreae TaxID=3075523 RepID=A0ABU2T0P9_9ACTN|nr:discoidin domain-containing protein [Streptomyces sp. DSM 41527]MDT0454426.1 discoidin domain-containing protein [Streptomyces sp. DSM 41527]